MVPMSSPLDGPVDQVCQVRSPWQAPADEGHDGGGRNVNLVGARCSNGSGIGPIAEDSWMWNEWEGKEAVIMLARGIYITT